MDNVQKQKREIFFNNLILLDLDKYIVEKKYGITLHKDMFMVPNKKGFEVITYFLFSKLNEVSEQSFEFQWPLLCKEDDRCFQKSCFTYLSNIAQGSDIKFPRFVPSVLSSYSGDRFYAVYFSFSCYVLKQTLKKITNKPLLARPVINQGNFKATEEILHTSSVISMERFKETQRMLHQSLLDLLDSAKNLSLYLRKLKSSFLSNQTLLKEKKSASFSLCLGNIPTESKSELQKIMVTTLKYQEKVKELWKYFEKFILKEKELWNCVSSEIEDDEERPILDGSKHKIELPVIVLKECKAQLKKVKSEGLADNGKLNIKQFLQLLIIFLEFYVSHLKKIDIYHLQKYCSVKDVSDIKDDMNYIKLASQKLILDSSKSIEILKRNLITEDFLKSSEAWCKEFLSVPTSLRCRVDSMKDGILLSDCERLLNIFPVTDSHQNSLMLASETHDHTTKCVKTVDEENHHCADDVNTNVISSTKVSTEENYPNLSEASQDLRTSPFIEQLLAAASPSDLLEDDSVFLDSINFDQNFKRRSQHFKIRDSWLTEESLNAMTLEDIEIVD